MNCPACGTSVPDSSAFCPSCGAATRDPTAATVAIQVGPPPEDPLLVKVREALAQYYVVEKELGRGGMAVVYRGKEKGLEREVAIKVLPPEMALQGGTAERFRREARLAASLEHQNVIPVYRVGEEQGLIYMAMKFVRGRALDSILEQQGALPIPVVVRVLAHAAAGLAHAHDHQIVHRDIKGANILIELDGRVLVSDFGIARAMTENSLTASGMVIGTPNFMSPEQCGGGKVGPQSDQYSIGVLGFQMLTGQLPFEADSIMGIIQHHYMTPPPDITAVREGVPHELLDVLYRALAKKPEERYATTHEMAEALEAVPLSAEERRESLTLLKQLSQGEAVPKVRTGSLPPLSLTASISGQRTAPTPQVAKTEVQKPRGPRPQPKAAPKGKGGLVAAVLAVLVLAGGGGGAYWKFVMNRPAPVVPAPTGQPATQPATAAPAPATAAPPATAEVPPATAQPAAATPSAPVRRPTQDRPRPAPSTQPQSVPTAAPPPAAPAGTGTLLIRATPSTASVVVNGEAWGLGGGQRSVPAGTYAVRVSADGCESVTRTVTVEPGGAARLPVILTCQAP
jgi:serine/threonine-protein kinase